MSATTVDLNTGRNEQLESMALAIVQRAGELTIVSEQDYADVADVVISATEAKKAIEQWFEPLKSSAYRAWKAICSREDESTKPLEHIRDKGRRVMSAWKSEQERQQRERERAAAEAARQAEQDRQLAEAAALERDGYIDLAESVVAEAVAAPAPVVILPAATPTVAGVSYRKRWRARVVDATKVPREFLVVDEGRLDKFADAMGGSVPVAGVEFYCEQIPVVRGRR